jgi:low affinity Fe/Cu permease
MNLDLDYNTLINSYIYISVGIIQETQRISTFAYMHSRISERISRM